VVPPRLVDIVAAARASASAPASALDQAAVAMFMVEGHFARHLRRMRAVYRERGEALVEALGSECGGILAPRPSDSGMQLWAELRGAGSDVAARDAAAQGGIEVGALSSYFIGRPRARGLVFGFGGVRPAALRAAVHRLARAIEAAC
jgi:GntR family transcriptional regulator/MocR family aminotransferase